MHELVPGESIGPFRLGMALDEVAAARTDWVREQRMETMVVLTAGGWHLFFENGQLSQVGATAPLEVHGPWGLRLGGRLGEITGALVWDPDDCVLSIDGSPGLTIDISEDGNEIESPELPAETEILWLGLHRVVTDGDDEPELELVELC